MFYGFQESSLKTITETIFKTGNWSIEKTQYMKMYLVFKFFCLLDLSLKTWRIRLRH